MTVNDDFRGGNNPNLWKAGTKDGNETRLDQTVVLYSFHPSSVTDRRSPRTFSVLQLYASNLFVLRGIKTRITTCQCTTC